MQVVEHNQFGLGSDNRPMYRADGEEMDEIERNFVVESSLDRMPLTLQRRCLECRNRDNCEECAASRRRESFLGSQSRLRVWENLKFDEEMKRYVHDLDFSTHACGLNFDDLPSNERQARCRYDQFERNVSKLGPEVVASINDQIREQLQSGQWVTLEELYRKFPHVKKIRPHYSALGVALKSTSVSTPVRLILDTAIESRVTLADGSTVNLCFNSFLSRAGLTEPINDLVTGLRSHPYLAQADLSRYYQSVAYTPESSVRLTFHVRVSGVGTTGEDVECVPRVLVFGSRDSNFATACALFKALKRFATYPQLKLA